MTECVKQIWAKKILPELSCEKVIGKILQFLNVIISIDKIDITDYN